MLEFSDNGEYRNAVAADVVDDVTSDIYMGSWEDSASKCAVPSAMRATVDANRLGSLSACQKSCATPSGSLLVKSDRTYGLYAKLLELTVLERSLYAIGCSEMNTSTVAFRRQTLSAVCADAHASWWRYRLRAHYGGREETYTRE